MKRFLITGSFCVLAGQIFAQIQSRDSMLYLTQLKAAESYYRLNQIGEAKTILNEIDPKFRQLEWQLLQARTDRSLLTLTDHNNRCVALAVSPDGKWLASGSADQSIIIRNASTYETIRKITGHRGQVSSLEFSPDSETLISGSADKSLRLWNVLDGQEIKNFNSAFTQGIYHVKFNHDGSKLGVVSWEFSPGNTFPILGFLKVLDVRTGEIIRRIETDDHPASAVKFSRDDKKIYTGTWGFHIKQHDINSGAMDWDYDMNAFEYYTAVQSIDVSPDNRYLVESGKDNKIRMLDAKNGKLLYEIEPEQGHTEWVNGVRFSPDGVWFASVADDGLLKIWETGNGRAVFTLKGHTGGINQVAWHPDGKRVFTTSSDHTVKIWDIGQSGELQFKVCENGPWNLPVSPDGLWLASANSDKVLNLFDLNSGKQVSLLDSLSTLSAVFSNDGKYLAAGNRKINIYETGSGKKVATGSGHTGSIYGMDFNQRLNSFVTAGDRTVRFWHIGDTAAYKVIPLNAGVYTLKFSRKENKLFVTCTDGKIRIFSGQDWILSDSLSTGKKHGIFNLGLSGDEKKLIASGDGGEVSIYNLASNTYFSSTKHTKWVYGLAVHPTQPLAATASYDKTIRFWDLNSGVNTLTLFGFDKELYTLAFSPDGKKLVVGQVNGVVKTISF